MLFFHRKREIKNKYAIHKTMMGLTIHSLICAEFVHKYLRYRFIYSKCVWFLFWLYERRLNCLLPHSTFRIHEHLAFDKQTNNKFHKVLRYVTRLYQHSLASKQRAMVNRFYWFSWFDVFWNFKNAPVESISWIRWSIERDFHSTLYLFHLNWRNFLLSKMTRKRHTRFCFLLLPLIERILFYCARALTLKQCCLQLRFIRTTEKLCIWTQMHTHSFERNVYSLSLPNSPIINDWRARSTIVYVDDII